ncbi:hypothetical protein HUN08_01485 [Gordonia sp. X0973]|uniref:hypothetical protein n=1 Tax=Gordonia sp. X0973 TaxID=2742602 RepID=UPI000F52FB03|nr:hypothetical protein [Gordonia sp. X0973]QKT06008.1 hypothetical protein HUN08_01485 [Gordonia sp. X0973]
MTQDDLDALAGRLVDLATSLLAESHEFLPVAMAVSKAGDIEVIAPNILSDAPNTPSSVSQANLDGIRSIRDSVRAYGEAVNVRLPTLDSDGIDIALEHEDGTALSVTFPYVLTQETLEVGRPTASSGETRVWTSVARPTTD